MSSPYAENQKQLLNLVRHNVNGLDKLFKQAQGHSKISKSFQSLIDSVTLELQDNMDKLTPENYIYAFNNILTPDMRTFMRDTPVMYLPPLRPFSAANMTRKNRRNRRSIGGNGNSTRVNTRTPYDILESEDFRDDETFPASTSLILNMIANGADVNEERDGTPLLHNAFGYLLMFRLWHSPQNLNGVISIIRELVKYGADIDSVSRFFGETLLEKSLSINPIEDIELLLELGATVTLKSIKKSLKISETDFFLGSYDPRKTLLLLNSASESVLNQLRNNIDETGGNFLHHYVSIVPSIFVGSSSIGEHNTLVTIRAVIQKLLEIGINPEAKNAVGQTPARLAINMGLQDIADMLTVRPERSPNNRRIRNIYGISTVRASSLAANQRTRHAAGTAGGRRRRHTRRR